MSDSYTAILLSDRALLRISGDERHTFLQQIITQDIDALSPENSLFSCILTPQGKVIYDFFLYDEGESILLDCHHVSLAGLQRSLSMYKLRSNVTLEAVSASSHRVVAIVDSNADFIPEVPGQTTLLGEGAMLCRDPRFAAMGARLVAPVAQLKAISDELGLTPSNDVSLYDAHRIALGIPECEKDFTPSNVFPLEYGLDALNAISFTKGCYVGQEVTARSKHRGSIRKQLYIVEASDALPASDVPLVLGERKVGIMHSFVDRKGLALMRIESEKECQKKVSNISVNTVPLTAIHKPAWRDVS